MLAKTFYILMSAAALILILINFLKNRQLKKIASQFPGPFSFPIIGCALLFLGTTEDIFNRLTHFCKIFPSPFRFWLGSRLMIVVYTPEESKTVLLSSKALEKDDLYSMSKPWLGAGLLTAPEEIWRFHRKLIQPAFNQKILQSFVEIFQRHSILLTKDMAIETDNKEFDVMNYISIRTLNIIGESAMGVSILSDKETTRKYFEAFEKTFEGMVARVFKFWLHSDIIFEFTKLSKEFQESTKILNNITDEIIQTKRKKLESSGKEIGEAFSESEVQRKPFLDLLMDLSVNEQKLTDLELRHEVSTMIFGGQDTSKTVVSYAMLMLASYPDTQDKAYEEIFNIYGDTDPEEQPVKPEDLQDFLYLERVIKETMRLFPVAPVLVRKIKEDLKIGEHTLPKGSSALVCVSELHRDEKIWPDPLKFDPDRFLPEEIAKRHPYSYIPFSAGSRNCIGQVFAMMSMKVMLSTILRKYNLKKDKVKPIENIRVKLDLMLRQVDPVTVRIEKRISK